MPASPNPLEKLLSTYRLSLPYLIALDENGVLSENSPYASSTMIDTSEPNKGSISMLMPEGLFGVVIHTNLFL